MFVAAVATASAQSLAIVSGNGQVRCGVCLGFFNYDGLTVRVTNSNGTGVPNVPVTYTAPTSDVSLDVHVINASSPSSQQSVTVTTDANGYATAYLNYKAQIITSGQFPLTSVSSTSVNASIPSGAQVAFKEFSSWASGSPPAEVVQFFPTTAAGTVFSGAVGVPTAQTLQGHIGSNIPGDFAGIAVAIIDPTDPGDNSVNRTLACAEAANPAQPNVVYTAADGTFTCTLTFLGSPRSSQQLRIDVGSRWQVSSNYNYSVTVGPPKTILEFPCGDDPTKPCGGNNQTGLAGQRLVSPLNAILVDAAGNPIEGAQVKWEVIQGTATVNAVNLFSAFNGAVSASVILGGTPGTTLIRVSSVDNPSANYVFTENVKAAATGLTLISGNNTDAAFGTQFPPLVVQLINGTQPVSGVNVTYTVTSGDAKVANTTVATDATGVAQGVVTAGNTAGPITVTASSGTFSVTFNLTVRPPGPSNLSFLNGAGFQKNQIAPCGVATITGTGIATGLQGTVVPDVFFGPLPYQLAKVTVQFGNIFAPVYNVSNLNGQESVTVQVPCELQPGTVPVTMKVGNGSGTTTATVSRYAPGIFEAAGTDGVRRAVVVDENGNLVTPSNRAQQGHVVRMYVTGLGTFTGASTDVPGLLTNIVDPVAPVIVGVANQGVRVVSVQYVPNEVGVYQIDFEVPTGITSGIQPLAVAVDQGNGNLIFGNGSTIPVQ